MKKKITQEQLIKEFKNLTKIYINFIEFTKLNHFKKIGSIIKETHNFTKNNRESIDSPEFVKDNDEDEIATPEGFCYLWVLKKNSDYFMLYIGESGQTFEKRFNSGHRRACRERSEKHSNKTIRFMNILRSLNDDDEVQVWVRKSDEIELFDKTVSLRKAEEDALIRLFKPYLNV